MNEGVDINAIAADAASKLAREAVSKTFGGLKEYAVATYQKFFMGFEKHLSDTYSRIAKVKIITSKDAPINFKSIYVASNFRCGSQVYRDQEIVSASLENKRCIVKGNGGTGKSFLLRHLWLSIVDRKKGRVPIFIELRRLNGLSSYDIESFIRAHAFGFEAPSESAFRHFCDKGLFVFILDGFDEVARDKRDELERQILSLSEAHKACGLVVSGRPDDRFDGWQDFRCYEGVPMDFLQFRELIEKVPFDSNTKKNFTSLAKIEFFKHHESFLSNPLLALMMLLTFRDNAEIPTRLSVFYENCCATLYSQHDAMKESYRREKSLDQFQFKRVFSVFCLISYKKGDLVFDGAKLLEFIEKARSIAEISIDPELIKQDFLESVNLLVKEGHHFTFIHRSFQEFFAAYAVTNVLTNKTRNALSMLARRRNDSAFRLAFELHRNLVLDAFIFPTYDDLYDAGSMVRKGDGRLPFKALAALNFESNISFLGHSKRRKKSDFRIRASRFSLNSEHQDLMYGIFNSILDEEELRGLDLEMTAFTVARSFFKSFEAKFPDLLIGEDEPFEVSILVSADKISAKVDPENAAIQAWVDSLCADKESEIYKCHRSLERTIISINQKIAAAVTRTRSERGQAVEALDDIF